MRLKYFLVVACLVGSSPAIARTPGPAGPPAELLQVSGQEHMIMAHDKRIEWSLSIVAWLDRWLKHDAGWWEHMWPPAPVEGGDHESSRR